ncbi:Detected protein of unknown function [Hibiscus syriacus]|uniref:Uncharacterized protein n=1 Tax=Hibiscus syriacus TaxID=106335 RepID=A0A6A2ZWH6_HIBSY|nr:Detected protein of unknown function [Hibiscus syriacus]
MGSDFTYSASLPCSSKKKRVLAMHIVNINAYIEPYGQSYDKSRKLLTQVKNKDCKVDLNRSAGSPPFSTMNSDERNKSLRNLQTSLREEESEDMSIHDSDVESLNFSIQTDLGNNDSKEATSVPSCCDCSSGSCSGSGSEEDKDGCLDNWEDVADALSADENQHDSAINSPAKSETMVESAGAGQQFKDQGIDQSNSEIRQPVYGSLTNCRAWRPDDVSRPRGLPRICRAWRPDDVSCPQSLPRLSKQHDISLK